MERVELKGRVCGMFQIWQFADQGRTGFLSRVEFYNALKLVTVAQTGREITPELVRAALTGPAAAQIPPPRIGSPGGQAGGAPGAAAAVASSQAGGAPVRAPGPPAAQGVANGQESQARSLQGSNGGPNARQAGVVDNGLAGSQGAPAKQFSPHTNSGPSAPMAQGGHGGAAKQLAPQTNSLSAGGSGVPQLTPQTSSLSRYPPSAGQLQVPPTGFAQQGWARPPAPGGQAVRPSLGSLFTTNSVWPPKESNPPSASQGSGSTSVSSGQSVTTTPSSGPSRSVTPASSASTVTSAAAGGGTTTAGQGPASRPTKDVSGAAGFNGGIDLFSSGFNASPNNETGSRAVGSGPGSGSEVAKAVSMAGGPAQAKQAVALPLDESIFSAPAIPAVQMSAQGGGKGVAGGGASPQGAGRGGAMDLGPGSGARAQGGPVAGGSWPQMSENDVQRYSRVFTKVDTDKDGKITGEQARALFLSWQLPRGKMWWAVRGGVKWVRMGDWSERR
jgi:epidermal growth factor receptor substrate 15